MSRNKNFLNDIPSDIKNEILALLNTRSIVSLSRVDRHHSKFIDNENRWEKCCKKIGVLQAQDTSFKLTYLYTSLHGCMFCRKILQYAHKTVFYPDFFVCNECNENCLTRITATNAKKEYKLSDADLLLLPCETKRNPYSSNRTKMRLFAETQVRKAALNKFGGEEGLEAARLKSFNRSQAILRTKQLKEQAIQKIREKRKNELTCALRKQKMQLRSDSKLCQQYIDGSDEYSIDQLVEIMVRMHIVFEHTNYKAILQNDRPRPDGWLPREEYRAFMISMGEELKMRMYNAYMNASQHTNVSQFRKCHCCQRPIIPHNILRNFINN